MNMPDIETIISDFGKIQQEVSARALTHYPAHKFPKSLLPYKKEEIASAIQMAIKIKEDDPETVDVLRAGLLLLDDFIDDREAYNLNHKLLAQDSYWEAIRK